VQRHDRANVDVLIGAGIGGRTEFASHVNCDGSGGRGQEPGNRRTDRRIAAGERVELDASGGSGESRAHLTGGNRDGAALCAPGKRHELGDAAIRVRDGHGHGHPRPC